uniref:Small ribosomal subunit protein uS14c n=1 Tax=Olisthodiscus luteus TaxID=83000 RepID=A0A7U0QG42_OLILU|nr:ribosomal protein S14 [Olisthodiscus luteus]QQW50606.1 ribosomal protein S14 [Olisthodiscus luteus]
MAKKNMVQRELKRQKLVKKGVEKRKELKKEILKATDLDKKLEIHFALQKMKRDSSPVRLRNRCWKTGRSRGVYRDFGLSRHSLREMAHECLLPGVTKASW